MFENTRPLSDRDHELLSAYIDGALSDSERAALDSRLQSDDSLRRELDDLTRMVALIRAMPTLTAPRFFALTREMVNPPRLLIFPATAAFSALSAAAAVILLVIGVSLLTPRTSAVDPAQVAMIASPELASTATLISDALQESQPLESAESAADDDRARTAALDAITDDAPMADTFIIPSTELPFGTLAQPEMAFSAAEAAEITTSPTALWFSATQSAGSSAADSAASELERQFFEDSGGVSGGGGGAPQSGMGGGAGNSFAPDIAPAPFDLIVPTLTVLPTTQPAIPTFTLLPTTTPIPLPQPSRDDGTSGNVGAALIVAAAALLALAVGTTLARRTYG